MPENIRNMLSERDIAILCKKSLTTLDELSDSKGPIKLSSFYNKMDLKAFNLENVMPVIFEDYLLPNNLIEIDNSRIKITPKGREIAAKLDKLGLSWKDIISIIKGEDKSDESSGLYNIVRELVGELTKIYRPKLFFDIAPNSNSILEVVLRNSGREPAYDITCTFDPDIPYYGDISLGKLKLLKYNPFLERDKEIRFYFNYLPGVLADESIPKKSNVTVRYSDSSKRRYVDDYELDLTRYSEIASSNISEPLDKIHRDLRDIYNELKDLRKHITTESE